MGSRKRKKRKAPVTAAAGAESDRRLDEAARARRALRMIVVLYVFLAFLYARSIPLGKGPDESAHVRYVQFLAENHHLPVLNPENPDPDYEFHQPPLYYALCLPAYVLAGENTDRAQQAVRFFTMLMSIALIYLTFSLARMLAPDRPWIAPGAAGMVAFLPMHLGVASSVSNDVLAEIFCAATLLVLVQYLRQAALHRAGKAERPPGPGMMGVVGLLIGLGLLTKSVAVLLFPVAWLSAALAVRGANRWAWRRLARDIALTLGVALAVSGWWLVRNQVLYGDLLAHQAFLDAFQGLRPSPRDVMADYQGRFPPDLHVGIYLQVVVTWTLASILGVFGPTHGNHFLFYPYWIYLLYGLAGATGMLGFARHVSRTELVDWQRHAWWVCGLFGALLLASFVRFNFSFFQAQARYLFPILPAAAVACCLGLQQISPPRWRDHVLLAAVIALAVLALAGLPLWIVPQFLGA